MKEVIHATRIFETVGSDIYLEYKESISGNRMYVAINRIEKIEYVKPLIIITLKEEVLWKRNMKSNWELKTHVFLGNFLLKG